MCGIIGYIGNKKASNVLLTGLKRMEYRGYDSSGIAVFDGAEIKTMKAEGQVKNLESKLQKNDLNGKTGIGHTRWATHGDPSDTNAHPHTIGSITLVHNGIIENNDTLKLSLQKKGYAFKSATDTEVLCALIDSLYQNKHDIVSTIQEMHHLVKGTFGLAILFADHPDTIVTVRRFSPILIAKNGEAVFVASDQYALTGNAGSAMVLGDNEMAICSSNNIETISLIGGALNEENISLDTNNGDIGLEGHQHFMHKEIFEQPESIKRTLAGRLNQHLGTGQLGGINMTNKQLRGVKSLLLVGCGTSYHAGLTAKYLLEPIIKIPINVEIASELRYRNSPLSGGELAIAISQSGETADTIACVEELKLKGIPTYGIVNVIGSTIARMVDGGTYTHSGPEISVASTKAYSSQVATLLVLGLLLARQRGLTATEGHQMVDDLSILPELIKQTLSIEPQIKKIAAKLLENKYLFVLGRDTLFPVAQETALKIKEITYTPTFGMAAGEMKHGPHSLIDNKMGIVMLLGKGQLYDKSESNLQEVLARGANTLVITDNQHYQMLKNEELLILPESNRLIQPLVFAVAGQLLAYHLALKMNREIDKPRNLAKSVTVE